MKIFVNLPVRSAAASAAFWNGLGYPTNPLFADERTSNVVLAEDIVLMLLEHSRFADFVTGPIADPAAGTGALYALSADSREAVDALVDGALAAGGSAWLRPTDHGFMYARSFRDLDGHVFEVLWMDPVVAGGGTPEQAVPAEV